MSERVRKEVGNRKERGAPVVYVRKWKPGYRSVPLIMEMTSSLRFGGLKSLYSGTASNLLSKSVHDWRAKLIVAHA